MKKITISFLNIAVTLLLFTSCETEILDHIDPKNNPEIADYIPNAGKTDSVFSEVKLLRSYTWFGGEYSIVQDSFIKTFTSAIGMHVKSLNLETLQQYTRDYDGDKYNYGGTYASDGNTVLLAGGYIGIKHVENISWPGYEKATDLVSIFSRQHTWAFARLSKVRYNLTGGTVGNLIFFAGGQDTGTYYSSNVIDIYNTTTNMWSTAQLTIPRSNMVAVSAGDKIFFAGGTTNYYNYKTNNYGRTGRIDIYDAKQKKWSIDSLSYRRTFMLGASVGNEVFFIGGQNFDGTNSNIIEVYNVKTEKWRIITMNSTKSYKDCIAAGNLIFFINTDYTIQTIDYYNTITGEWKTLSFSSYPPDFPNQPEVLLITAYNSNRLYLHGFSKIYEYELK